MSLEVPDLLNSLKASADTPDAEFTGTIDPFTVVDGASGTASLLAGSGTGLYDVSSRTGWVLFQVGTASAAGVELKQDYTLPDGKCIVAPVSFALDYTAAPANNELWLGIGVNDNDSGPYSGTTAQTATAIVDTDTGGHRVIAWDGSSHMNSSFTVPTTPAARDTYYLRIDRSDLTYYVFYSTDGFSWTHLGSKTMATAANNVWLFAQCNATMANRAVVGCPWFREGTALAVDPFPL